MVAVVVAHPLNLLHSSAIFCGSRGTLATLSGSMAIVPLLAISLFSDKSNINIMNEKIKLIQDTVNSKPCGYCGKTHKVELKFTGMADNPVVSYSFSDDTCKEFKVAVHEFVRHMLGK